METYLGDGSFCLDIFTDMKTVSVLHNRRFHRRGKEADDQTH